MLQCREKEMVGSKLPQRQQGCREQLLRGTERSEALVDEGEGAMARIEDLLGGV